METASYGLGIHALCCLWRGTRCARPQGRCWGPPRSDPFLANAKSTLNISCEDLRTPSSRRGPCADLGDHSNSRHQHHRGRNTTRLNGRPRHNGASPAQARDQSPYAHRAYDLPARRHAVTDAPGHRPRNGPRGSAHDTADKNNQPWEVTECAVALPGPAVAEPALAQFERLAQFEGLAKLQSLTQL